MSQRAAGRLAAATALAVALALFAPVSAEAAERRAPGGLWSWLESLLPERIVALSLWGGREERRTPRSKQGTCIDPDGCADASTIPQGGPTCQKWNEQGVCIDPDG